MKKIRKIFFALGTVNSIAVDCEETEEASVTAILETIEKRILKLDDELSVFKEGSQISKIRRAAGKELVEVSADTYTIVKKSLDYAKLSQKTFDITSRPLSELWGIGKKGDYIPLAKEIKRVRRLVNYKDVILQTEPYRIGLKRKGQAIDLGGIAKGFAADWAREILLQAFITEAVINFGGTIVVIGKERIIGIRNPQDKRGQAAGSLPITNQAVVTSGVYERYFQKDGVCYHHILDLSTGSPANSGLSSVTAIGASAMESDILAKTVLLLGIKEGIKLLRQCSAEAVLITDEQKVYVTSGLKTKFKMTERLENSYGNQ